MAGTDTGSILWQGIFGVLCIELFLVALLCVPMPMLIRKPILRLLGSGALDSCATALKWVFGIILVFFFDAVRRSMALADLHDKGTTDNLAVRKDNEAKMFRAQRNIYLAGSTLVLLIILNKLYHLSREVVQLTANLEVMEKQAKQASAFAQQMMAESKDDTNAKGAKGETTKEETFPDVPSKENDGLRKRVAGPKLKADKKSD